MQCAAAAHCVRQPPGGGSAHLTLVPEKPKPSGAGGQERAAGQATGRAGGAGPGLGPEGSGPQRGQHSPRAQEEATASQARVPPSEAPPRAHVSRAGSIYLGLPPTPRQFWDSLAFRFHRVSALTASWQPSTATGQGGRGLGWPAYTCRAGPGAARANWEPQDLARRVPASPTVGSQRRGPVTPAPPGWLSSWTGRLPRELKAIPPQWPELAPRACLEARSLGRSAWVRLAATGPSNQALVSWELGGPSQRDRQEPCRPSSLQLPTPGVLTPP